MHSMSINTAQQLVADRRASYEGFATRRRLRKLARHTTHGTPDETGAAALPPAPIAVPRNAEAPRAAARKVA